MVQTRRATKGDRQDKEPRHEDEDQDLKVKPNKKKTSGKEADEDGKTLTVPFGDKQIACERHGETTSPSLIFTHGAGGNISTPATSEFAHGFADVSTIVAFNGSMNLKNRVKAFGTVADSLGFDHALGGRSMGARAACMTAVEEGRQTKALVLVSFPLVADKNKDSREQVLLDLPTDMDVLFISGTKDSMCDLEQLQKVIEKMKARVWLVRVEGADHGMSWGHKDKDSVQMMRHTTGEIAAEWLQEREASTRYKSVYWEAEATTLYSTGWAASSDEMEAMQVNGSKKPDAVEAPPAKRRKRGKD